MLYTLLTLEARQSWHWYLVAWEEKVPSVGKSPVHKNGRG